MNVQTIINYKNSAEKEFRALDQYSNLYWRNYLQGRVHACQEVLDIVDEPDFRDRLTDLLTQMKSELNRYGEEEKLLKNFIRGKIISYEFLLNQENNETKH